MKSLSDLRPRAIVLLMHYPKEQFTEEERSKLANHFTNLESPVFGLINLPETVKGALFARYSRYQGSLRRLFLDEFADGLPDIGDLPKLSEGRRAAELYERVFIGFGDDSVAQLGGVHLACEWTSNLMTKILQRPRLAAYLEQSTRYIPYDSEMPGGGYRYYRHPSFGIQYQETMDTLFRTYSEMIPIVTSYVEANTPKDPKTSDGIHRQLIRAKALDLVRGLLPTASLSHMGIFASGQALEGLVMHLLAHPLPEARHYGSMVLHELEIIIPSFVGRIDRPDRGGEWIQYLKDRGTNASVQAQELGLEADGPEESHVKLLDVSGTELDLATSLLFEASQSSEDTIRRQLSKLDAKELGALIAHLAGGERKNRRHRPGRGFERVQYRFEVVSDYGAFRDLQRHRMLTAQWQQLNPDLGADVPQGVIDAGLESKYQEVLELSQIEYERLQDQGLKWAAPYALSMAFKCRYIFDMNAREAMQMIELRSGKQGHTNYRVVAQDMHTEISKVHPSIGAAMQHVDHSREETVRQVAEKFKSSD